jgi:hypothetical protein
MALFVNADSVDVKAAQDAVKPELLQFHGDESAEACASYQQRFLRAFRVGAPGLNTAHDLAQVCARYGDAAGWFSIAIVPSMVAVVRHSNIRCWMCCVQMLVRVQSCYPAA